MKFRLRLLLVAFAVSLVLVGALSLVSIARFSQLSKRVAMVEHTYKVVSILNMLEENVREMDRDEFRYLLTRDSTFAAAFNNAVAQMHNATDSLKLLTTDERQMANIIMFESDIALYLDAASDYMNGKAPVSNASSAFYQHSKNLMNAAAGRLAEMARLENKLLLERQTERRAYQRLASSMILTLSVVFGLFTVILFVLLLRSFRQRLRYQAELQQKIHEIAQSKRELEHIAYATTHDLQEPLRKIRILTDRWQHQQKDTLTPDGEDTLNRVVAAAARMQDLVGELMILTTLNDEARPMPCSLHEYAGSAAALLSEQIAEKGAQVDIEDLPVISGHPDQLKLLFKNLLHNALKFARPDVAPVISITARKADSDELGQQIHTEDQYYCITIQDNGVGFDNKMVDKIFGIFRQLHTGKDGYTGKGSGLAICQRIMSNHKGLILAHGFPDAGATFKLYFPAMAD